MTERDRERRSKPQGASGRLTDEADPVAPARPPLSPPSTGDRHAAESSEESPEESPEESGAVDEEASPDPRETDTAERADGGGLFDLPDDLGDLGELDAAAIAGIPQLSELDIVKAERDEFLDALRRLQADFDNFRKRVRRQQEEQSARGAESLVERLLPVLDAVDLAVAHAGDAKDAAALTQVAALLHDVLQREGVERIDAAGVAFEPTIHDAVAHVPREDPTGGPTVGPDGDPTRGPKGGPAGRRAGSVDEGSDGSDDGSGRVDVDDADVPMVAEVLRPGYLLKGKVLRPAMVKVSG
jgi:molecular chaperone GrpE